MKMPWFENFAFEMTQRMSISRLHHAILIAGSKGIGKHLFSKAFSKQLLCKQLNEKLEACGQCQACMLFEASNHPDFYWLSTDKSQIGVDLIRQAIESLNAKSQLGHNKVLVIPDAHLMTESSANALLKTLEEPTLHTFIVLVTHQPNRLLPTILSRCEKHYLATPPVEQSLVWLQERVTQNPQLNPHNREVDEPLLSAFGLAPVAALDSLMEENVLQFGEFSELLSMAVEGQQDVFALATKWQDSSEQVIQWLQRYLRKSFESAPLSESGRHWGVIEEANNAALKVRHPGTNKAMLLFQLLTKLIELNKQCT